MYSITTSGCCILQLFLTLLFFQIPHSMWWAIITLCTVGYGDMSPITPLGRLLGALSENMWGCPSKRILNFHGPGCMCCVCGVVMVALPISVISSTFQDKYEEHLETKKIQEAKRHRENEVLVLVNCRQLLSCASGSIRTLTVTSLNRIQQEIVSTQNSYHLITHTEISEPETTTICGFCSKRTPKLPPDSQNMDVPVFKKVSPPCTTNLHW